MKHFQRVSLLGRSADDIVREVLADIQGGLLIDGTLPGTPAVWWPEALRLLSERFGPEYDERLSAARRYTQRSPRTAAALSLSGLGTHPAIVLALCEAAP